MRFTQSASYPMTSAQVEEMSLDPQYIRSRFSQLCDSLDVKVEGRRVRAMGAVSDRFIPAAARSIIRGAVTVTFTEEWSGDEGRLTATTTVKTQGAPVALECSSTMMDEDGAAVRAVSGDLSVSIPFFGARIEREALEHASKVILKEVSLAKKWCDAR
ncbi:DUF2505 domain-containing protein [Actinomyces mediterranea]|uniref:DUF2505 domain-containing protein n=1 Tax=Actinomyces mediterranea TaxID=1871028 RepID=UPI0009706A41|nr:DUF2505 domain-containing protein [Actinomyces mediterranea]